MSKDIYRGGVPYSVPDQKPSRHSFDELLSNAKGKQPFPEPRTIKRGKPKRLWPPE